MTNKTIRIKKLTADAVVPTKAHATDAGFDLTAVSCAMDDDGNLVYGTGIALEIPDNHVGLVFPRSSNARKDLRLTNCVGVIDSGYRGEITAKFRPTATPAKKYAKGDRIAQLIIVELDNYTFVESDELSDSERGVGGYGSTGK